MAFTCRSLLTSTPVIFLLSSCNNLVTLASVKIGILFSSAILSKLLTKNAPIGAIEDGRCVRFLDIPPVIVKSSTLIPKSSSHAIAKGACSTK